MQTGILAPIALHIWFLGGIRGCFGGYIEPIRVVGCDGITWQRLTGRHAQVCLGHADRGQALRLRRTAARLRGLTATRMAESLALVPSMARSVRHGWRGLRAVTTDLRVCQ